MASQYEMQLRHRNILKRCRKYLLDNLLPDVEFWRTLVTKNVFTNAMTNDFTESGTQDSQVEKALDALSKRGPEAFESFLCVLEENGHEHVAKRLRHEETISFNYADNPDYIRTEVNEYKVILDQLCQELEMKGELTLPNMNTQIEVLGHLSRRLHNDQISVLCSKFKKILQYLKKKISQETSSELHIESSPTNIRNSARSNVPVNKVPPSLRSSVVQGNEFTVHEPKQMTRTKDGETRSSANALYNSNRKGNPSYGKDVENLAIYGNTTTESTKPPTQQDHVKDHSKKRQPSPKRNIARNLSKQIGKAKLHFEPDIMMYEMIPSSLDNANIDFDGRNNSANQRADGPAPTSGRERGVLGRGIVELQKRTKSLSSNGSPLTMTRSYTTLSQRTENPVTNLAKEKLMLSFRQRSKTMDKSVVPIQLMPFGKKSTILRKPQAPSIKLPPISEDNND